MLVTVSGIVIAAVMFCVLWTRSTLRDIDGIDSIEVNMGVDDDGLRTISRRR